MNARMQRLVPQLTRGPRRGAILMLSLWLILVLTVMAYSLTYEMRVGLRMTGMGARKIKARALARAGVA
jgi:type II secretory pathway component PulK